jgi:hypothetical protein
MTYPARPGNDSGLVTGLISEHEQQLPARAGGRADLSLDVIREVSPCLCQPRPQDSLAHGRRGKEGVASV